MSPTLLIFTICLYLISLVASLLLGMASKKFKANSIRIPILLHFILLTFSLVLLFLNSTYYPIFILITFCSGLLLSIWVLRKKEHPIPLKIYFGLFLASIILFLASPGKLFYLISGNYENYQEEKKIDLTENYFLIEQRSLFSVPSDSAPYKIIKQKGFYKKTLLRDVIFEDELISGKMIQANEDTIVLELTFKEIGIKRLGFKSKASKNNIYKKRK